MQGKITLKKSVLNDLFDCFLDCFDFFLEFLVFSDKVYVIFSSDLPNA